MIQNRFLLLIVYSLFPILLYAKTYYVSPKGDDSNSGTKEMPFASLAKVQSLVQPGDTVYLRGGTFKIAPEQIMSSDRGYVRVFDMKKSGSSNKPIFYWGYPGERPVFDLSAVRPENKRVSVFFVSGSWLHFKNFEVVGTQVTMKGHTQSECFSNRGGNNNIYENLAMHDGMAIGFYLVQGANNLVINCDAYNNYDDFSEGPKGGNVDGFGGHPTDLESVGNTFRYCRAWYNSDDGFDLINAHTVVSIEGCWSFWNGYQPGSLKAAGDGTGFKAGGYGMGANPNNPTIIPRHRIVDCIAYYNKNKGFYANHHLGGIDWINNSAYNNPSNFCMLNRASALEIKDVPGYDHVLKNNLSYAPRSEGKDLIDVDLAKCRLINNSFNNSEQYLTAADFVSLDARELLRPRNPDGSLPAISFLRPRNGSSLFSLKQGIK